MFVIAAIVILFVVIFWILRTYHDWKEHHK